MPNSLKNIQVEQLGASGAFILHEFHTPLTIVQGIWLNQPKDIAYHSDLYDQLADRLGNHYVIDANPRLPVRLHSDNVFLLEPRIAPATSNDSGPLPKWLTRFEWPPDHLFSIQEATSAKPIEDGFLRCLRIIASGCKQESIEDDRLHLSASQPIRGSLFDTLSIFMHDESERIERPFGCEQFLHEWYKAIPKEGKTHPGFAILRQFDDGVTRLEFAGSIISAAELRFWSRVVCYHR